MKIWKERDRESSDKKYTRTNDDFSRTGDKRTRENNSQTNNQNNRNEKDDDDDDEDDDKDSINEDGEQKTRKRLHLNPLKC